jgi:hypothetical protein
MSAVIAKIVMAVICAGYVALNLWLLRSEPQDEITEKQESVRYSQT